MKKKLLLLTACALMITAQPTYGMSAVKSLQTVSNTLDHIQKSWKPIAVVMGTVTATAAVYILWKKYSAYYPKEALNKHLEPIFEKEYVTIFKKIQSLVICSKTSSDEFDKYIDNLKPEVLEDVLKYNNNPQAQCVEDMETLYYFSKKLKPSCSNQLSKQNYILQNYYYVFKDKIAKIHQEIFLNK